MTSRHRQTEQDRLLRDLARELRGLRADGGAERLVERQLASLEARIENLLEEMLTRMLGQMLGGGGGVGGLLSGLVDLPRLADGGVVDGAQLLALGGEAGPEAVLPLTRLADGSLGVRAEAGQAPVIVNITLGDGTTLDGEGEEMPPERQAALAAALGESLDQALDQAVAERIRMQLRDGGLLNGGDEVAG
jgi:phage-related minor tail protein